MVGKDAPKVMEYSLVTKIPESEGLLVRQCTSHLGKFGLTIWVVSILMCEQELHHFLCLLGHMPCGSSQLRVQVSFSI